MSGIFKRVKGFADIYGQDVARFNIMESCARNTFAKYGFNELRTPVLEQTGLFLRSIGTETDVVQKEMFTFPDRKGRSITLRPEATAGVMRAFLEESLDRNNPVARLFTIGPMFRYERPQKGRMRQFHQINCECLGSQSPYADAELICMLLNFLEAIDIRSLKLKINSLGCKKCRPAYMRLLGEYLHSQAGEAFCDDCRRRMDSNPLRVLDCKQPHCRELAAAAPRLLDHNCEECRQHFDVVTELLSSRNVDFEVDHNLVRGLDYYCRTTFEVVSNEIGAQTAVAGGGRYDGLIAQLGGADVPGVGFACGMERLALLMPEPENRPLDFYMLSIQAEQRPRAFELAQTLRKAGFFGEMNYEDGGFKGLMRRVSHSGARICLILGPDEAASNSITLKDMETGRQTGLSQDDLCAGLAKALNMPEKA